MKQSENIEVATLKEQIDLEIEKGNYERVDSLTKTLCEIQGLDSNQEMPKSFILKIKIKERVEKLMNTKKNISKAAAVLLMLGVSGGVVYGSTQHFRNVEHAQFGLTTGSGDIVTEDADDSGMKTERLPEDNEKIEIISTERGNKGDLWTAKEVRQETYVGHISEDGVNWEEDTPDVVDVTEYSYKDYRDAIKDTDFKGLFAKTFEQDGDSIYSQWRREEDNIYDEDILTSNFKYNNGRFEVDESRSSNWDGKEIENVVITSSTGEVMNQREYTSANGDVFKLSDDKEMGKLRTTVLVSYDEYSATITFTDLSDKEIHEILDAVSI